MRRFQHSQACAFGSPECPYSRNLLSPESVIKVLTSVNTDGQDHSHGRSPARRNVPIGFFWDFRPKTFDERFHQQYLKNELSGDLWTDQRPTLRVFEHGFQRMGSPQPAHRRSTRANFRQVQNRKPKPRTTQNLIKSSDSFGSDILMELRCDGIK